MPSFSRLAILFGCVILSPATLLAQGILVCPDPHVHIRLPRHIVRPAPTPPVGSYVIKSLDYSAAVVDQIARVETSQTFRNIGAALMEVCFVFPLPYDGAVDRMTLMVDGKEMPAQLVKADEARRIYEEIVRKNRDPALLEWVGTGMFKTSVFPVPAGAERTVSLRYSQLLRKEHGVTDLLIPLGTAKYTAEAPENVRIRLTVEASSPIKNVYSPSHVIEIQRPDDRHAVVKYSSQKQVPSSDFRLLYDCGAGSVGTSVLSYRPSEGEDGYFLLLASPEIKSNLVERQNKTCVFVVDRSGSMSGPKIEQAKSALRFVLNTLREGDLFNILTYDSEVTSFRPELQRFSEDSRRAALGFVEGINAGGSTNIDAALRAALGQLVNDRSPSYVIFTTDGLPTAGETKELRIVNNAKAANKVRARVFDFGVGYDVNARLLDRLARECNGQSQYVRPDENIESHVGKLCARIGAPALSHVSIAYGFDSRPEEGQIINRTYPQDVSDLFEGDQLVIVGRYRKPGAMKVTVTGRVGPEDRKFDFNASLSARTSDETYSFIEKLWAVRRIGEIIDYMDLSGRNEELVRELVTLSTRHGVLTPYTSFLANETTDIRAISSNARQTEVNVQKLESAVSGDAGVAQRAAKGGFMQTRCAPASGGASYRDMDDKEQCTALVQNVGNKTFYCREQRWIDSTVTAEQEKNAVRLVQFSDEYFKLAAGNGRAMSQYLAVGDSIVVNIAGQCYRIEPGK